MARAPRNQTPSSDAVMQTLLWMRKMEFKPVPLVSQSKAAIFRDYALPNYRPPDDDFWRNNNYGAGCVTGPLQKGPIDADLDCEEAVYFARRFLPATPAVFGRETKRASHYLYRTGDAAFEKFALVDPVDRSTIIELRGDGGHQTVMPGSIHESTGELIEWEGVPFPDVPVVSADDLRLAARKIALATLITRHIYAPGYHNEPVKHLAGMLFYLEWPIEDTVSLIEAVMEYTGDTDKSRIPTIRAAYKRGEAGKKISGAGVLRKQVKNDALVDKLLELAGSPTVNLLTEYNERFAVVSLKGKFRIASTDGAPGDPPVFHTKEDWTNFVATDYSDIKDDKGRAIPKHKLWLANPRRRTYRAADFLPGAEEAGDTLNLWTGWSVPTLEPKEAKGKCDAWLDLLYSVICGGDDGLCNWMLHWFANIVRDPRDKSLTAPVIIGPEGAGKSLLLGYFGRILGPAYVTVTNEKHIHGEFNDHLARCLLLHSEEALYAGDKKHASIIRSLITDEHRMYEQKGIDAVQVKNYLRLVLTSNELHAAPAKPGDRRYTVIDMEKRLAPEKLWKAVLEERNSDGPAALFRHLLDMDYDPAVARTNVKNEGLRVLKTLNMTPIENWWYDVLMNGQILPDYLHWASKSVTDEVEDWPEVVSSTALHVAMTLRLRERGARQTPTEAMLAVQLDKFLNTRLHRTRKDFANPLMDEAPSLVKQMSARQSAIVNMPDLKAARVSFELYLGQKIDWPHDEPESDEPKEKAPHDKY